MGFKRSPSSGTRCFRRLVALVLLFGVEAGGALPASAQVRGEASNQVGVELLGRAGIYSVNFEHLFDDRFGVGGGVAVWAGSGDRAVLFPLYASWTPIGRTHRPYLAVGATGVVSNVSFFGRSRAYETGAVGHAAFGYEFVSRSGLVIRPAANYFFGGDSNVWWPGILIGVRF